MRLVEGQIADKHLTDKLMREFYLNSGILQEIRGSDQYPQRIPADFGDLEENLELALNRQENEKLLRQLRATKMVFTTLGGFRILPENACVFFEVNDSCSYEDYVSTIDDMRFTVRNLRAEFAEEHFGMTLEELEKQQMKAAITAVELIFPLDIVEPETYHTVKPLVR